MDRRLRRAVLERLAAVEESVLRTNPEAAVPATRRHLRIITNGWRKLLLAHQPDDKGRCPVCSGWLRRRRWPCQIWVTAHQHLIGFRLALPAGKSDQETPPPRPPRRVDVIPRQVGPRAATGRNDTVPAEHTSEWLTPEQLAAQRTPTPRPAQRTPRPVSPTTTGSIPIYRAAVTGPLPVIPPARFRQN